jgi:hypothetical protein
MEEFCGDFNIATARRSGNYESLQLILWLHFPSDFFFVPSSFRYIFLMTELTSKKM